MFNPFATIRSAAITLAVVALFAILAYGGWQKYRSQAAQGRLERGQTEALGNSARDAIATQGTAAARETASNDLTRTNEEEIRNAQGADDRVNPAVRDAGHRSLCRRAAYRNSERCGLRPAPSP